MQTRVPLLTLPMIHDLGRIEQLLDLGIEQRTDHRARHDVGDDGAVLGRDLGDEARRPRAAGARHVLRHDVRIARDVAPDVPRHHAPVDVVAAAGRRADQEVDRLAGEEILRGGGGGDAGGGEAGQRAARSDGREYVHRTCLLPRRSLMPGRLGHPGTGNNGRPLRRWVACTTSRAAACRNRTITMPVHRPLTNTASG